MTQSQWVLVPPGTQGSLELFTLCLLGISGGKRYARKQALSRAMRQPLKYLTPCPCYLRRHASHCSPVNLTHTHPDLESTLPSLSFSVVSLLQAVCWRFCVEGEGMSPVESFYETVASVVGCQKLRLTGQGSQDKPLDCPPFPRDRQLSPS